MWIPPAHSPVRLSDVASAFFAGTDAIDRLETHLTARFEADWALGTGSGTQALQLGLRLALDAVPAARRSVALPAYGCFDLATAAVDAGAPVVLYDIQTEHLTPDPASFAAAAKSAGVLVTANLYGFPLDMDHLRAVARRHDAVLVEDAAQAIEARWSGRASGSFGDLTVLSFGRGKGWTGGGGGALLGRDPGRFPERPALPAATNSRLAWAARTTAQWALSRPLLYGIPARIPFLRLGETVYHPPGRVHRIHPVQAALAWRTGDIAIEEARKRRPRAEEIRSLLNRRGTDLVPRPVPGGVSGDLRAPILLNRVGEADEARLRRSGIYRGYPVTLDSLDVIRALDSGRDEARFAGAERLARELFTVPTHSRIGVPAARQWVDLGRNLPVDPELSST